MFRIILFLVLIAVAAFGAAWMADQPGSVVVTWSGGQISPSLPVFALMMGGVVLAAMLVWAIVRALWRAPERNPRCN